MKKSILIACAALFLASFSQAYSPPENITLKSNTVKVDESFTPSFQTYSISAVNHFDYDVVVLEVAQAPAVFALTSDTAFTVSNITAFGVKNSYLYVLKPPLRYLGKFANFISTPNYFSPYTIRKNLPQKRC